MYIRSVTVENVKSFRDEVKFSLTRGVNYFVGDNNSGKSTILEAILFLFQGPTAHSFKPEDFYTNGADSPTRVIVDLADVEDIVADPESKFHKLASYVFEDDGAKILRLMRSSDERTVAQGKGKKVALNVKTPCFWNPENDQFENATGIPALVKALFDFEVVWADAHPDEHIDFAGTKTLGRLFESALANISETPQWEKLKEAHEQVFMLEGPGSFRDESDKLSAQLESLVDDQYGEAKFRFNFSLPKLENYMKQGELHVDDGLGETPVSGKGMGMQRAIMLALIQLYAKVVDSRSTGEIPLILMLDEPETWLHPRAQFKLGEALSQIGKREQIFILTHSPYLIRTFDCKNHLLTVLSKECPERRIITSTNLGLLGAGQPSWGEINYRAFEMCTPEFHDELFSYIQENIKPSRENGDFARLGDVDNFLESKGVSKDKKWRRPVNGKPDKCIDVTLAVYIRNVLHHPENRSNPRFEESELWDSTQQLLKIVNEMRDESLEGEDRNGC